MDRNIGMSLFESIVFPDIMQIVSSDNDSSVHLGADHHSFQYLSSDWHVRSEWTFLIDVWSFDSFFRSLESQPDVFEVPNSFGCFLGQQLSAVQKHGVLFLESLFDLYVCHAIKDIMYIFINPSYRLLISIKNSQVSRIIFSTISFFFDCLVVRFVWVVLLFQLIMYIWQYLLILLIKI